MNEIDATQTRVLIVDDVAANLKVLRDALEPKGYEILGASNGKTALKIAVKALPDIILLDIMMPNGMDGYEVCRQLKQNEATADIPVIFITMKDEEESIVEGFQVGSVDYITKPFYEEEVLVRVETHLKISRLTKELAENNAKLQKANTELLQEIARREEAEQSLDKAEDALETADDQLQIISQQEAKRWGIDGFIGKSRTIRKILDDIRSLQDVGTTSVLILGESGTGKELIARAIHFGGSRAKGQFIPVNCSTIPHELAESTLFGHVAGAFTGAKTGHKGYFELASGGTLFLDEIGDMPLELQTKLLRTLEDGCIMPVGSTSPKQVDVRILAATNADLRRKIAEGTFRQDLYFRLARFTVDVPPLREREEDIPLLAEHFLTMFAAEMGFAGAGSKPTLSPEAQNALENYRFPGNIRELKNIIEHALILSRGSEIQPEHLHLIEVDDVPAMPFEHSKNLGIEGTMPQKQAEYFGESEQLMFERAQTEDEKKILAYLSEHDSINNQQCRELLDVDKPRASYLLKKLHRYGLLVHEGERRWSRYRLKIL